MRKALSLLCTLLLLAAILSGRAAAKSVEASFPSSSLSAMPNCTADITPTIFWTGKCEAITSASCFEPARLPTASDVLLVVGATSLRLREEKLALKSIIVGGYAWLELSHNAELSTSECFVVYGTVALRNGSTPASPGPGFGFFKSDPSVPLASCATMPGGFSPRICGPGVMYLYGIMTIHSYYAASWAHTVIMPPGTMEIAANGSFVGRLENYGTLNFGWSDTQQQDGLGYLFGDVTNFGQLYANVCFQAGVNYPFAEVKNLDLINYGYLAAHFCYGFDNKTVKFTFTNYNHSVFTTILPNFSKGAEEEHAAWSPPLLDATHIYNAGTITFRALAGDDLAHKSQEYAPVGIVGPMTNAGLIQVEGLTVKMLGYFSLGGTMATDAVGSFVFGNGAGVSPFNVLPCEDSLPAEIVAAQERELRKKESARAEKVRDIARLVDAGLSCSTNATCQNISSYIVFYCAHGTCQPLQCPMDGTCPGYNCCGEDGYCETSQCGYEGICCPGNGGCNEYNVYDICDNPYGFFSGQQVLKNNEKVWSMERKCKPILQMQPLSSEFAKVTHRSEAISASRRYFFDRSSVINGNLLSTEPVEVAGKIVLGDGALWTATTEFGMPLILGGGRVTARRGSRLVLGLDSSLSFDGGIEVESGASLLIPRHSRLLITNHSITVSDAASGLLVDGTLALMGNSARVKMCGHPTSRGSFGAFEADHLVDWTSGC